jgi:hypothetical protein
VIAKYEEGSFAPDGQPPDSPVRAGAPEFDTRFLPKEDRAHKGEETTVQEEELIDVVKLTCAGGITYLRPSSRRQWDPGQRKTVWRGKKK